MSFVETMNNQRASAITVKRLLDRERLNFFELGQVIGAMRSQIVRVMNNTAPGTNEADFLRRIYSEVQILQDELWAAGAHGIRNKDASEDGTATCDRITDLIGKAREWHKEAY